MQKNAQTKNRLSPHMLMFYWLAIMALLLLLVAATYTWFSISKTPRVNAMDLYVTTPAGLQIALNYDSPDEEWGQAVQFADMVTETAPLKPCTWSDRDGRFYAAVYGADGRMTGDWTPLSDEINANVKTGSGYYTMGTIYARSDSAVKVSLSEAVTMEDGTRSAGTYLIGTPVWNGDTVLHDNGGSGAEYAVRIGLRITPVDQAGEAAGDTVFYIYEPNSDAHANGGTGYLATPNINGGPELVPAERLITQTTSSWTEVSPVQQNVTFRTMGQFTSPTELFSLEKGQMVRIDLYIWLEGQDVDCTNQIGSEAMVLASIQFAADYGNQSGMVPID